MAHGTFIATANELHGRFPPLLLPPLLSSLLPPSFPPHKKRGTFYYRNISGEEFIFYYSFKLIPKTRRRGKLQALQFYIKSKTINLQRVKTVIIFGEMVCYDLPPSTMCAVGRRAPKHHPSLSLHKKLPQPLVPHPSAANVARGSFHKRYHSLHLTVRPLAAHEQNRCLSFSMLEPPSCFTLSSFRLMFSSSHAPQSGAYNFRTTPEEK